jgi:uncharacterized membrane protein (UPF0127 family)
VLTDLLMGLLLLPAAIADSLVQLPAGFTAEDAEINGRHFRLYRARTAAQWQQGFKGREVAADEAMLFEFPSSGPKMFWMKGTLTPLDMVFLDERFRVLKVVENAQPCGLLCRPYFGTGRYVLEVRAGVSRGLLAGGGAVSGLDADF